MAQGAGLSSLLNHAPSPYNPYTLEKPRNWQGPGTLRNRETNEDRISATSAANRPLQILHECLGRGRVYRLGFMVFEECS